MHGNASVTECQAGSIDGSAFDITVCLKHLDKDVNLRGAPGQGPDQRQTLNCCAPVSRLCNIVCMNSWLWETPTVTFFDVSLVLEVGPAMLTRAMPPVQHSWCSVSAAAPL